MKNNFAIISEMKFIPQVILVYTKNGNLMNDFSLQLVKKIVCINPDICNKLNLCGSCYKINNNTYFDFKKYDFNKTKVITKAVILEVIADLFKTTLEKNAFKIYLINGIEYSSTIVNNMLLKTLENMPNSTYIIFTTNNLNKVLDTIKSRCYLINLNENKNLVVENQEVQLINKINFNSEKQLKLMTSIVENFIFNDNNNKNNNYFLIKEIANLKENIIYFFRILNLIIFNKINFLLLKKYDFNNEIIKYFIAKFNSENIKYLTYILEEIQTVFFKLNYNININLLLNDFFIKICRF